MTSSDAPLIAHLIYCLDFGGLENGLVNLVNQLPPARFRHVIICLTRATDFRQRISRADVEVIEIGKRPGKDPAHYLRLWRELRRLRPVVLHTRNLATLEYQWMAWAAGVPVRIHGEHGWDHSDVNGTRLKNRLLRRGAAPVVQQFVAMSRHIAGWLAGVGVGRERIRQIYNGVDVTRFGTRDRKPADWPFERAESIVIGTVGRMSPVKDQLTLVRAFLRCIEWQPELARTLRLALIGDGPLLAEARRLLEGAGAAQLAWLPGARNDVPELLAAFDLFALPSLNEGISNTILEAMASALPVIATRVGGNAELVEDRVTGRLVAAASPDEMARALLEYAADASLRSAHGEAARLRAVRHFGLERMILDYLDLYQSAIQVRGSPRTLRHAGER